MCSLTITASAPAGLGLLRHPHQRVRSRGPTIVQFSERTQTILGGVGGAMVRG